MPRLDALPDASESSFTSTEVATVLSPMAEVPRSLQVLKNAKVPVEQVLEAIARGLQAKTKDGREDHEKQLTAASLGGKLHRLWSDDAEANIRTINFTLANFTPDQLAAFTTSLNDLGYRAKKQAGVSVTMTPTEQVVAAVSSFNAPSCAPTVAG